MANDLGTISILVDVKGQPLVKELAKDLNSVAESERKVSESTKKVIEDFKRMQQISAMLKKETDSVSNSFQRLSVKDLQQTSQRLKGLEATLSNTRRGMGQMGVAIQQTGYQVGDFLVQIQSGTNPLVAFGQQATQLVGILPLMGAGFMGLSSGALVALSAGLGIAIPLVTAIGAAFLRTGEDANTGAGGVLTYSGAISALTEEIRKNQEQFLKLKFDTESSGIASASQQIEDLRKQIPLVKAELDAFNMAVAQAGGINLGAIFGDEGSRLEENLKNLEDQLVVLEAQNEAQNMLNGGLSTAAGIQKGLSYDKTVELRLIKEGEYVTSNLVTVMYYFVDAANSAAIAVSQIGAEAMSAFNTVSGLASAMWNAAQARISADKALATIKIELSEGGIAMEKYAGRSTESSRKIEDGFGNVIEKVKGVGGAASKSFDEATKSAETLQRELEAPLVGAVGSISDAFGDFVSRGLTDFKGFVKSIIGSFQNMISQMIAMAVKNRIMLSLGIGGVTGTAAAAGQVAGLGSAGGMLGSLGIGQGIAGLAGGTGFLGGAGNAVAGLAGGGAGFFGIGANATAAGGGVMATLGAAVPVLGAVSLAFAFLSKKTKELDSGLRVTANNMGAVVETFKTVQTSQFFGLSKNTTTTVGTAGAEVSNPITAIVATIQSDIVKMANALSVGSDAFNDFSYTLDISLKGLTEEQAATKVQEELTKVGDAMADLIPEISSFAEGAETTTETLNRLYLSLETANAYFSQLSDTMFSASLSGASLASNLIQAFGSVDAFNSSMAFFTQNFYSEAEQVAMASDRVNAAFQALGLAAPATADAFRQLVQSLMSSATAGVAGAAATLAGVLATQQDVATVTAYQSAQAAALAAAEAAASAARAQQRKRAKDKAEQERYNLETQLLQLQGNTAELRRRELELLSPTNRALQEMIWKLEDAKTALEGINEIDFATKVDYLRAIGLARNSTPGFATGGDHMGGPRIVGENGPELEVTGPSRIYSNQDTAAMFRDPNLASAVLDLRREISGLRSEQLQIQVEISKNVKRTYDIERKWDIDGLPPVRV